MIEHVINPAMEAGMTSKFSREDILNFLDFLANKGLQKKATVVSRKAAVNTLLSILNENEASNLQDVDIDDLLGRFSTLKGQEFKPASLQVYKSRLNTVLSEFKKYKANPINYKPQERERPRANRPNGAVHHPVEDKPGYPNELPNKVKEEKTEDLVFPIPLRRGVIVRVSGIPTDLTPDEATKIGNVILALSGSQEG